MRCPGGGMTRGEVRPAGASRQDLRVQVGVPGFAGAVQVRDAGPADAPVVLLLHGFGGSLAWVEPVVPLLRDRFRVLSLDLLGHGRTGGSAVDAPVQAAAVAAVLTELEVSGVTAVGHSFGADVAVELAERCDRVRALVIVTQAPDYRDATLPRVAGLATVPLLGRGLFRFVRGVAPGLAALARRRGENPAQIDQALRDLRALNPGMLQVVLIDRRDRMARRPLDVQVRAIVAAGKPTLVVLGGRDHFYGARSAPRYRAAGAQVEVLPDSTHSPLLESPAVMAALIGGFAATDTRPAPDTATP